MSDEDNNDIVKKSDSKQKELAEIEPGEGQKKDLKYPKQVFFIIGNEFCERFSYYGMKAVLSIYLKSKLHFDEDTATVIYHTFSGLCYTTPIFGAMLADQLFGKYRTIIWISVIYVLGHLLKTLAAIPTLSIPPVEFSLIGLLLIAIGTGGIKPCVAAFGGDQFKLPEQERLLQTFFSIFYFSINAGSLISTFITPIFRQDVHCFGDDTCYSLAFGVPALLMFIATIILILGRNMYIHKPPQGSIVTKVLGCIWLALKKTVTKKGDNVEHWLDRAKDKYEPQLIRDTKILLHIIVLYLPLPVFWALFDQQGSRWTFQATRMNGQLGSYIVKPDQMQLFNPALILILIPLFDQIIYPLFAKINFLKRPLQRMITGGVLAAAAFFISGVVECELSKTYENVPTHGLSHAHFMNILSCDLTVKISNVDGSYINTFDVGANLNSITYDLKMGLYNAEITAASGCNISSKTVNLPFEAKSATVSGLLIRAKENKLDIIGLREPEEPKKNDNAAPRFKVIFNANKDTPQNLTLRPEGIVPKSENDVHFKVAVTEASYDGVSVTPYGDLSPGAYDLYWNEGEKVGNIKINQGGVHTFVVYQDDQVKFADFLLTPENSLSIFWLFPQYFVITVGEIMFSITALEFSYSQAPATMKSVLQAINLLTVAFGNLIVIIVAEAKAFDQASEFFMFGCLMLLDMGLFAFLAYRYTYVTAADKEVLDEDKSIPMEEKPSPSDKDKNEP